MRLDISLVNHRNKPKQKHLNDSGIQLVNKTLLWVRSIDSQCFIWQECLLGSTVQIFGSPQADMDSMNSSRVVKGLACQAAKW